MNELLFYILAALTLGCGLLVVANPFSRNPVTSAMFLVMTILSMAGLFVLLGAFFLAAVQVVVYAGAVIVLFLFVIMLMGAYELPRRAFHWLLATAACLVTGALAALLLRLLSALKAQPLGAGAPLEGSTALLGRLLFTDYLLPFEVVSVVLLVAMVGVMVLSRKEAA